MVSTGGGKGPGVPRRRLTNCCCSEAHAANDPAHVAIGPELDVSENRRRRQELTTSALPRRLLNVHS
jgi:hypothetical protein